MRRLPQPNNKNTTRFNTNIVSLNHLTETGHHLKVTFGNLNRYHGTDKNRVIVVVRRLRPISNNSNCSNVRHPNVIRINNITRMNGTVTRKYRVNLNTVNKNVVHRGRLTKRNLNRNQNSQSLRRLRPIGNNSSSTGNDREVPLSE